ncbi:MAG: L,D-transpeptidase [Anaerolineae bacterium]|nr:L,D-transpeptidase [Anaerolineae bacterium]
MTNVTRRGFLRSAGLAGAAAAWRTTPFAEGGDATPEPPAPDSQPTPTPEPEMHVTPLGPVTHWDGSAFGRVLLNAMTVYRAPSWRARATGRILRFDEVVEVVEPIGGEGLYSTNHTWLEIRPRGFIYSSWVQPVLDVSGWGAQPIGEGGAWGHITVPYTRARTAPSDTAPQRHILYCNTVNRVIASENEYYRVKEVYGYEYWVKAAHMRLIPPEEIGPIAPEVPPEQKRIEISIGEQRLYAFQGEELVRSAIISSGVPETPTPFGEFHVFDKRPGQRMTGGLGAGAYNLPGVPWICYFTKGWIATHGAYWHNDFGRRHSNGCINMTYPDAQWVFRWTTPGINYQAFNTEERIGHTEAGTRVVVRW